MTTTARRRKSSGSADPVADRLDRIERVPIESMRAVMRVKDLARYLGKSEATVRDMLTATDLPRHYDGTGHVFFIRRELEGWLYFDNGAEEDPRYMKRGHIGLRWLTKKEGQHQARIWSGCWSIGIRKTLQPVPIR